VDIQIELLSETIKANIRATGECMMDNCNQLPRTIGLPQAIAPYIGAVQGSGVLIVPGKPHGFVEGLWLLCYNTIMKHLLDDDLYLISFSWELLYKR
jgi:amino acid/polyamine/organocation transporter, APC superfamily (TC 2.A.3)